MNNKKDIDLLREKLNELEETATTANPIFWLGIEMAHELLNLAEQDKGDKEKVSKPRRIFSRWRIMWRALRRSI